MTGFESKFPTLPELTNMPQQENEFGVSYNCRMELSSELSAKITETEKMTWRCAVYHCASHEIGELIRVKKEGKRDE